MLTVTTPATSRNLTTVQAVKAELAIADSDVSLDAYFQQLIRQATAAMEAHCYGRVFARQTYQETRPGMGDVILRLTRRPIVSVSQILFNGSPITDYTIEDPDAGFLYRARGWDWTAQLAGWSIDQGWPMPGTEEPKFTVDYVGGWTLPPDAAATLPADVQRLCVQTVKAWYLSQKDSPAQQLIERTVDDLSLKYAQHDFAPSDLPTPVIAGLGPYRDIV